MRAWLACVVASGCYLQPTVFEGGATVPAAEPAPAPVVDAPVGCITEEPGIRRVRPTRWWLGDRRVASSEIDRALAASGSSRAHLARARRDQRLTFGLWGAGFATVIGSLGGMVGWLRADPQSREPLVMLAPMVAGYALVFSSVPLAIRGDHERRLAVDDFNEAAARENRCPP
ncbi:MAG TPA: hypothetical protein VF945_02835 [Polyangia bacterium]